jgi:hypothetical protein
VADFAYEQFMEEVRKDLDKAILASKLLGNKD